MSPSLPENSPNLRSSSASRSRCSMICFAVVAAIRPKPSGVSSYSPTTLPSSSSSAANTVTCPVLRSSSTRACSCAPGRLVVRRQQRLLDRLDEHLEGDLLLALQHPQQAHVDVHRTSAVLPVELDLDPAPSSRRRTPLAASVPSTSSDARRRRRSSVIRPVTARPSARVTLTRRPALRRQWRGRVSGRSTPRRGHLEGVGLLTHHVGVVEHRETSRVASAMSSRVTPPSLSTATRSTRRLPAVVRSTASRSRPAAARGSRSREADRSGPRPGGCGPLLGRPAPRAAGRRRQATAASASTTSPRPPTRSRGCSTTPT